MIETGVVHGRFQVLHNDHLKYLLAGKARCRHLVVGVTNPDPSVTKDEKADPNRSQPLANPMTYYERYVMVRTVLVEAGLLEESFSVVPLPINLPDLYHHYVPLEATFFLTIYDDWGRKKLKQFQKLKLKTEVLWGKQPHEKRISGTDVRQRMANGEKWEDLVPRTTAALMKKWDIPERLRRLSSLFP
ncbi:MAG: nicotinate-nucleotide adenylyltransferase [Deltaproteobacteria bacterium]|nr:nicotinate-nucleotide adenylyltransferase [Deltaproteobacteria bacterium]